MDGIDLKRESIKNDFLNDVVVHKQAIHLKPFETFGIASVKRLFFLWRDWLSILNGGLAIRTRVMPRRHDIPQNFHYEVAIFKLRVIINTSLFIFEARTCHFSSVWWFVSVPRAQLKPLSSLPPPAFLKMMSKFWVSGGRIQLQTALE